MITGKSGTSIERGTLRLAAMSITALLIAGCALKGRMDPPPNTFIEDVPIERTLDNMPFGHAWIDPKSVEKEYDSVFVKPIIIDTIPKDAWERSISIGIGSQEAFTAEAQALANYFHAQLLAELEKVPTKRFKVVTTPSNTSLIVSIALTELELSRPLTRAAALAAPVPGVDVALNTITDPHVAFAARFTDPVSSQLQATAADRRYPPIRIVDLNKLTLTSSAREIVSNWSRELAEAIQLNRFSKVERTSRFSLLPW